MFNFDKIMQNIHYVNVQMNTNSLCVQFQVIVRCYNSLKKKTSFQKLIKYLRLISKPYRKVINHLFTVSINNLLI